MISKTQAAFAAIGLFALSGVAGAVSVPVEAYNASAPGLDVSVDVTVDNGLAMFTFFNESSGTSTQSSVARVYFESGLGALGLSDGAIAGGTGVSFSESYPGPASPPGGNTVGWAGELYAIGAVAAPPPNGINRGDQLIVSFAYAGTQSDLVDAVSDADGNARIAVHILNCVGGNSCAGTTSAVPLPAGLPLLLGALGALGFLRRQR